jgi:hypothetical protein
MVINGHDINGSLGYDSSIPGDELNQIWSCNQERLSSLPGFKYAEIMTDFQLIDTVYGSPGTGDGLLRIVEIDEDNGTMQHRSCSPDTILDYCFPGVRDNFTVTGLDFAGIRATETSFPPTIPVLTNIGLLALMALIGAAALRRIRSQPQT